MGQVEWTPPRGPYDPRLLLTGQFDEKENRWLRGLVDTGSFVETLGGCVVRAGHGVLGPAGVLAPACASGVLGPAGVPAWPCAHGVLGPAGVPAWACAHGVLGRSEVPTLALTRGGLSELGDPGL